MSKLAIEHEMTTEQFDRMVQSIKSLDAELGFAVNFTKEERKKYCKMGDKTFLFVDKTMAYSNDRPEFVPPYCDVSEFKMEFDLACKLRTLRQIILPVVQKINDSYFAIGVNAFSSARMYYNYIKALSLAGAPGSTPITEDLGKRYARTKPSEKVEYPPITKKE